MICQRANKSLCFPYFLSFFADDLQPIQNKSCEKFIFEGSFMKIQPCFWMRNVRVLFLQWLVVSFFFISYLLSIYLQVI